MSYPLLSRVQDPVVRDALQQLFSVQQAWKSTTAGMLAPPYPMALRGERLQEVADPVEGTDAVNLDTLTTELEEALDGLTISATTQIIGVLDPAHGGTGTPALTQGSVVFVGPFGVFSQDNANFFWDDTNNRLGLLTNAPTATLSFGAASTINTLAGALTLAPFAGQHLDVTLATTGDLRVNTNQLYVDTSAARVGINTAAPTTALSFGAASTISTIAGALTIQPASGSNLNVTLATTGDFAVNTNHLYVDTSAGSVGVRTTTPASQFEVFGAGTGKVNIGQWPSSTGYGAIYLNGAWGANNSYNFISSPADTNLYINRPTGRGIAIRENNADQIWIASGGNTGFGTTSPSGRVHISSTTFPQLFVDASTSATYGGIRMFPGSAAAITTAGGSFEVWAGPDQTLTNNAGLVMAPNYPIGSALNLRAMTLGASTFFPLVFTAGKQAVDEAEVMRIVKFAVGIKQTSPTAWLHIGAGTATAATAPLKFTTGTSLTAAEAGAMEFTTDDLFFTITTGAARKRLLMADPVGGLTAGGIPYITTNGRLDYDSALLWNATNNWMGIGVTPETALDVKGGGYLRVLDDGTNVPATTGKGLELNATATTGNVLAYDRGGAAYLILGLHGSAIVMSPNGTEELRADTTGVKIANLTSGRVVISGASGLLTDDADFSFATDTLTVTKIASTTFTGDIIMADGQDIRADTTTGTNIGTATSQKLGFWAATPIVQPTTGITAGAFVTNTSGILNDSATFDGYTLGQIAAALRSMGALA